MYYYAGKTIKEMRTRLGVQQERLLDMLGIDYMPVMHRVEKGEQLPRTDSLRIVFDKLGTPLYELLCPHIEGQPMEAYPMKHELAQLIDLDMLCEARALYSKLDKIIKKDDPISLQFMLCQEARIREQQGEPAVEIIPAVIEALKLTMPKLDDKSPGDAALILEEPELFFALARLYGAEGRHREALRILAETVDGLEKLPAGQRIRDRRSPAMLLEMCKLHEKLGETGEALRLCERGIEASTTRSLGKEVPEFLRLKASLLAKSGATAEAENLLKQAYAGFLMLGEKTMSDSVLSQARNDYGMEFETYGMENLEIEDVPPVPYKQGDVPEHKNFGELLLKLRLQARLTRNKLCQGICTEATLHNIETGETEGNMHYVEPMLERLGRDPMLYCNFFLNKEDFEAVELRDEIRRLFIAGKREEAAMQLEKLKGYKRYGAASMKGGLNYQFIVSEDVALFINENSHTHPDVEKKLLDALKLSMPLFDEENIRKLPLTRVEREILTQLAAHYMQAGSLKRAASMYDAIIANERKYVVDEYEMARSFGVNSFNYSTCLGRMERRHEALEVIDEALSFTMSRKRLTTTPALIVNKAYNLMKLGKKEESLAYFAMASFGFAMFVNSISLKRLSNTRRVVKDFFDIEIC